MVTATRGEHGTVVLSAGETVGDRRSRELLASARTLGVSRVELPGYRDSGMSGWTTDDDEHSFWRADVAEAASRLAVVLEQEHADVVTFYDETGGTGHPDHLKVQAAHASQIFETSQLLSLPTAVFAEVWGEERFIRRDAGADGPETSLLEDDR